MLCVNQPLRYLAAEMRHLNHCCVIKSDDPIRYPRHFSVEVKANGGRSAGKGTVAADRNLDWFPPQDREALFLCIDRFLFSPEGKRSEVARSRQGVTGSSVEFIYITLSSLMLLNWNTSLVPSTLKTRTC